MLNNEELRKAYSQLALSKERYNQEIAFLKKNRKDYPLADMFIDMNKNMVSEIDFLLNRLKEEKIFDDE